MNFAIVVFATPDTRQAGVKRLSLFPCIFFEKS